MHRICSTALHIRLARPSRPQMLRTTSSPATESRLGAISITEGLLRTTPVLYSITAQSWLKHISSCSPTVVVERVASASCRSTTTACAVVPNHSTPLPPNGHPSNNLGRVLLHAGAVSAHEQRKACRPCKPA
eukprot:355819-Chlamydomonas_euryale.AAC.2